MQAYCSVLFPNPGSSKAECTFQRCARTLASCTRHSWPWTDKHRQEDSNVARTHIKTSSARNVSSTNGFVLFLLPGWPGLKFVSVHARTFTHLSLTLNHVSGCFSKTWESFQYLCPGLFTSLWLRPWISAVAGFFQAVGLSNLKFAIRTNAYRCTLRIESRKSLEIVFSKNVQKGSAGSSHTSTLSSSQLAHNQPCPLPVIPFFSYPVWSFPFLRFFKTSIQ